MPGAFGELSELERAILDVPAVRGVSALHALDRGDDGLVVVTRVGLSPSLRLSEVVLAIAEVEHRVKTVDRRVRAVFVEPDIAADSATPTETIVIRALD
jgi:divalent metal cation (Fe/Co/Zn/Cd) transporter